MMTGAPSAPIALWGINVVGSLLLGIVTGAALPRRARLAVGTGLLGSFTSYSALAAFTADSAGANALASVWASALSLALTSVVVGVAAAAAGLALGARARNGGRNGGVGAPEHSRGKVGAPEHGERHDALGQDRASQHGAVR